MNANVLKYLYFLVITALFFSCGSYTFNDSYAYEEPNSSPLKERSLYNGDRPLGIPPDYGCWAKCLIEGAFSFDYEDVYSYTGDPANKSLYNEIEIEVKPAISRWVKIVADPACGSANPDDCLVWCLQEIDASIEYYREVIDTSLTKDFELIEVEIYNLESQGGFTEWKEVVCAADQSQDFYSQIQNSLVKNGFLDGDFVNGQFGKESKSALIKYQKENALPVGNLDFETLDALEVEY